MADWHTNSWQSVTPEDVDSAPTTRAADAHPGARDTTLDHTRVTGEPERIQPPAQTLEPQTPHPQTPDPQTTEPCTPAPQTAVERPAVGKSKDRVTQKRDDAEVPPPWESRRSATSTAAPTPSGAVPAPLETEAFGPPVGEAPAAEPRPDHPVGAGRVASSMDLTNALLIKKATARPESGWRRWLYQASARRINVGNSPRYERQAELVRQIDRHLVGCYRVAVLSLKGGVGKTTTTATLGSMFADIRGDRVIAVDANPDRGTLSQKVPSETPATVRNLLRDIASLERYSDVRGYTSQNRFRLEVLASDSDPAVSEAFSGQDYDTAVALLERFYSIVITDCGTGLMHSAMHSILEGADALVVVSSGSVDGARSASATLDWLDAHGYRELVGTSVAVVNAVRPRAGKVDLDKVVEHFQRRCREVRLIPFDPHLEEGAEIDLDRLKTKTRHALLELAAAVAAGFPGGSSGGPGLR